MKKQKVAVGPGASSLILIAVVLALSVLTVLTMISARNDEALAQRSVETRQEVYRLFAMGEESLARLDWVLVSARAEHGPDEEAYLAAIEKELPQGMRLRDGQVFWTERLGDRSLECAVRIEKSDSAARTSWTKHLLAAGEIWEEDDWGDFDDGEMDESDGEAEEPDESMAEETSDEFDGSEEPEEEEPAVTEEGTDE